MKPGDKLHCVTDQFFIIETVIDSIKKHDDGVVELRTSLAEDLEHGSHAEIHHDVYFKRVLYMDGEQPLEG
jgi:hypothetical protein